MGNKNKPGTKPRPPKKAPPLVVPDVEAPPPLPGEEVIPSALAAQPGTDETDDVKNTVRDLPLVGLMVPHGLTEVEQLAGMEPTIKGVGQAGTPVGPAVMVSESARGRWPDYTFDNLPEHVGSTEERVAALAVAYTQLGPHMGPRPSQILPASAEEVQEGEISDVVDGEAPAEPPVVFVSSGVVEEQVNIGTAAEGDKPTDAAPVEAATPSTVNQVELEALRRKTQEALDAQKDRVDGDEGSPQIEFLTETGKPIGPPPPGRAPTSVGGWPQAEREVFERQLQEPTENTKRVDDATNRQARRNKWVVPGVAAFIGLALLISLGILASQLNLDWDDDKEKVAKTETSSPPAASPKKPAEPVTPQVAEAPKPPVLPPLPTPAPTVNTPPTLPPSKAPEPQVVKTAPASKPAATAETEPTPEPRKEVKVPKPVEERKPRERVRTATSEPVPATPKVAKAPKPEPKRTAKAEPVSKPPRAVKKSRPVITPAVPPPVKVAKVKPPKAEPKPRRERVTKTEPIEPTPEPRKEVKVSKPIKQEPTRRPAHTALVEEEDEDDWGKDLPTRASRERDRQRLEQIKQEAYEAAHRNFQAAGSKP